MKPWSTFLYVVAHIVGSLLLFASNAPQAADNSAVRRAIDDYMAQQIKGLPGKVSYTIGAVDSAHLSETCSGYDISQGGAPRPWGAIQLQVRCRGGAWSLWAQVKVRVVADYLVTLHPIVAGQKISETDVGLQNGDLADLPQNILMDMNQAVGRIANASLPAGRPLRADLIKQATVIQQGQTVKIITLGAGFRVSNEGRALSNATIGQVTQVRLNSGSVLSGIVQSDGTVEIRF
ncbi:MAG TPA: flagellar basal body P-ring formation chaperone FlgA [Rhodocyclaceae bacterium]|nr:flagellar basal body P-ring formation chaperone FlgA [Rhodocyclaceae bacterium]